MSIPLEKLSKFEPAGLREVSKLSLTFILVLFSASLMGFLDRLILARYSLEGLEIGITSLWLSQMFQVPLIRAASMTQAFVGQYKGAGQLEKIGPCVWQMIWFSLLTMLIILPLGLPIGKLYFQKTALQGGELCFQYLLVFNFLFPLGTVLSAFYLGQGKTRRVLITSLASHVLHILLDFPLVFGVKGLIPPLGALGSILALSIAQGGFCLFLFLDFFRKDHQQIYHTHQSRINWSSFRKYLRISLPRSAAKLIQFSSWIAVTKIMVTKGGDYAAVLAFGGSLQMFFTCLNEGMSQALTTIGAYQIGAYQPRIWKVIRSGCLFLGVTSFILAIPLLVFPESVIALFFKQALSPLLHDTLGLSCLWIWLGFFAEGLNLIGFALLSAYGDTVFQMYFSVSSWFLGFIPCYLAIHLGNAPPESLWLILAFARFAAASVYFLRLRQEKWKTVQRRVASSSSI